MKYDDLSSSLLISNFNDKFLVANLQHLSLVHHPMCEHLAPVLLILIVLPIKCERAGWGLLQLNLSMYCLTRLHNKSK